ncbi:MAG: hypothetical protein C0594_13385 [Marinilabiliales bacterium]|nr:MAG: hypothetical protein C0594_13385 [Marinilabiliales bacterium]
MASGFTYKAFGLNIKSEIELPELITSTFQKADVEIVFGKVPHQLQEASLKAARFEINATEFLLSVDDVARYYVCNGNKITIEPFSGSDNKSIGIFLLGSCMGAVFHQRLIVPLHASAVEINNQAILVSGKSGIGKSTIAFSLLQKGFPLIADDICAISREGLDVYAGFPQMKQWPVTLEKFEINADDYEKIRPNLEKRAFPAKSFTQKEKIPIAAIFFVTSHNKDDFTIDEIQGIKKFNFIKENIYRNNFSQGEQSALAVFQKIGQLASNIPLYHIIRPNTESDPVKISDLIIKKLQQQQS